MDRSCVKVMMNFKSDNVVSVCSDVIEAILKVNHGTQSSYGADDYSLKLQKAFSDLFEKDVIVYLTSTGTAANSLGLASIVNPYESIYCHEEAHINTDECGAPEFYTGGAKLIPLKGNNGKIEILSLRESILQSLSLRPHIQKPGCISITQATECGTVYTLDELDEIQKIAHSFPLPIHMDGARFANSVVSLKCHPADLTWKRGVDVLSFGGTKNGAMAAEAVVIFNKKYAEEFDYRHKRAGQLLSKTRFFACQFLALLEQDMWLKNAIRANGMAQAVAEVFKSHQVEIMYPVEINEVFVKLSKECADFLQQKGCGFYPWGVPDSHSYRFVTSCFTTQEDIEAFNAALGEARPSKVPWLQK